METVLLEYALPCLCAFLACVGFTLMFNIHGQGKLIAGAGGALGWLVYLLLMAAIAVLLAWLMVCCLRQRQHLGRLTALAVVLSLGMETLFSTALCLGFVFLPAHLPLMVGNICTVLDMALIGLALSVFRGGWILRDELPAEKSAPYSHGG